ncbi:MAG TPA: hypothetical protein VGN95_17020 [Pyrinomonadaceae bacterium]|nr:hypothetical protein [Pyrinomonadaceae bacterium]
MIEEEKPDRFASGTGGIDVEEADQAVRPGVTGGNRVYLPQSGRADAEGSGASSAEGTIGAVGEMDLAGAPAGTSEAGVISGGGGNDGKTEGGGPGGGGAV